MDETKDEKIVALIAIFLDTKSSSLIDFDWIRLD